VLEFPQMLYRGEDTRIVRDADARAAAVAEGWSLKPIPEAPVESIFAAIPIMVTPIPEAPVESIFAAIPIMETSPTLSADEAPKRREKSAE
jgi:hypothetical protein